MTPEEWEIVEEVFHECRRRSSRELPDFLDGACGSAEIRRQVESLLAAPDSSRSVLSEPIFEIRGIERIGPYRLLGRMASNASRTVFLAADPEDEHGQRLVLKVLKADAGVVSLFRRKEAELRRLDHPCLVGFLDVGTSKLDEPYFVSEYVSGRPVDLYCEEGRLSIPERLELFGKICEAVGFAHRNQVAHLAIRPSKILVTAVGEPKILDTGQARLLELARLLRGEEEPATLPAERLRADVYASPEMVDNLPTAVTSDVYSLGVILYQMLTGRIPYRMESRSLAELFFAIRDQEPESPSVLVDSLPSEVDRIVLKALAKRPESRYPSAKELAEEIRRCLRSPVFLLSAVAPSSWRARMRRILEGLRDFFAAAGKRIFRASPES